MHTNDITAFQHSHIFHANSTSMEQRTLRVVLLTLTMMVVEIIAGRLFNSMALLADGWHMSTHSAALAIAWFAFILARRHSNSKAFTFGTWKIEILGGFVSAIFLGLIAVGMAWFSVIRLVHPVAIQFNQAIVVAVIGLAVNIISIFFLTNGEHGHAHAHSPVHEDNHGHAHSENLNLRAAYLHVLADALTSVLAVVALLGGKYMGWSWLDPIMGIVGAILITHWTYGLLVSTGGILLDRGTNAHVEGEIKDAIEVSDTRITDLHLWQVGQNRYACVLSLVTHDPQGPEFYKKQLRDVHELAHVTVEATRCE